MMFPYNPFLPQPPQSMTPPTIHADIIQIGSEQEAWNYPAGQIMMTRDENLILIKTSTPNGTPNLSIYEKRPERPQEAPSSFVTKEELAKALEALRNEKEVGK